MKRVIRHYELHDQCLQVVLKLSSSNAKRKKKLINREKTKWSRETWEQEAHERREGRRFELWVALKTKPNPRPKARQTER